MTYQISKKVIIPLRISSILYFVLTAGVSVLAFMVVESNDMPTDEKAFLQIALLLTAITGFATGIFVEVVILSLRNGKFWAWVAAIILCGLYLPSIFLPLGVIGLVGLLSEDTKKIFVRKR